MNVIKASGGYLKIKKPDWYTGDVRSTYIQYHHYVYMLYYNLTDISKDCIIHHIDLIRYNNDIDNLISLSRSEHSKLHKRLIAKAACGNFTWRKCSYCKEYDNPDNLYISPKNKVYHRGCRNTYEKQCRINKGGNSDY